jgi:2-keto-4-pentenoate hydratase
MRLNDAEVETIAKSFLAARREARVLDCFPLRLPQTLDDGYRVQERTIALDGRPIVGWKVAMIRADLRPALGSDRICGPIFAGPVHRLPHGGTAKVGIHSGGFAALEAEFAAVFGRDLEPGADGFTPETIAAALSGIHAGAEIASSPLPTLNDIGPLAVICDQGNNSGGVVGPELAHWRTAAPASLTSKVFIDGGIVGEGSAAALPGGPLGALQFLAEHLAGRGRRLKAGDIVLTGMTTGAHNVVPGSTGRIQFSGVADCDLQVIAFGPVSP